MNTKANEAPERLTALREAIEFIRNDEAYAVALREVETVERKLGRVDPPTGKVETVESALVELREMFPGKSISIRRNDDFYPPDCRDAAEVVKGVVIKIGYLETEPKFRGGTLNEAMAQVRAWKESQQS